MSGLGVSIREECLKEGREAEVFESVQEEDYSIERKGYVKKMKPIWINEVRDIKDQ